MMPYDRTVMVERVWLSMYEDRWGRFMQTGQIYDYLAYKGHPDKEKAEDFYTGQSQEAWRVDGGIHECGNTGVRNSDRDYYKSRINW